VGLLLAACTQQRTAYVTFGDLEGATKAPLGLRCRDSTGKMLVWRGLSGVTDRVSLVIDFVKLGGVPSCRTSELVTWCTDHDCAPLASGRTCLSLETGVRLGDDGNEVALALIKNLPGTILSKDAPSEPVLVRAVETAQTCDEVATTFDTTQLTGCALSCPVELDQVQGDVLLDLPALSEFCESTVDACATGLFQH
jgi:hypothetical protein